MSDRRPISAVLGHWPTEAIAKAASRHGAPSEVRIGAAVRALMNAGYVIVPAATVEHLRHAMQDADKMADDPTTARAILRAALNAS